MMYQPQLTPSQEAGHRLAKERAWRKIEAARRNKGRMELGTTPTKDAAAIEPTAPVEVKATETVGGKGWFDHHMHAWRVWQREQANIAGSPLRCYIRDRAIQLGYTYADIVGYSRKIPIVAVRHRIMWEVKTQVKPLITFPELGRLFGNRDHTSALWAVNKIQKIEDDKVRAG